MTETEQLVQRLERLERSHRRLKGFALAALLLVTALATIYATEPAPYKITAHQFDVVDDSGKVRVKIDANGYMPNISLYYQKGGTLATMGQTPLGTPIFGLFYPDEKAGVAMMITPKGKPVVELSDPQGFQMYLGSTGTVNAQTGVTEQTSAASIVMFRNDKEQHVLWKAP